jgi:hypothetical protein
VECLDDRRPWALTSRCKDLRAFGTLQRRGFSDATLSLKRQNFSLIGPIGIPCQEQPYFFPEVLTGME